MNINCLVIQCYISLLTIFVGVTQPRAPNHLIQTCTSGPVLKGLSPTNPGLVEITTRLHGWKKYQGAVDAVAFLTITPWSKSLVFWLCIGPRGSKKNKHDGGCTNSKQMIYRAIRKTTKQMPHKTSEFSVMSIYVSRLVYLLVRSCPFWYSFT